MIHPMCFALRLLAPALLLPLLTQCGTKSAPATNAVTGPFDSRGNYIEDWVYQPDKWYKPSSPSERRKPNTVVAKRETTPPPQIAVVKPSPQPSATKPTPKPVVKVTPKPKPKPKPVTVRHTVRKGDTLSGLARRYGSSVSKIQSANNVRGTVIRLGQTLTIPK